MMSPRLLLALAVVPLMLGGAAHAAPDSAQSGTLVSLTPEQVEAAKEAAADRNMKAASGIDTGVQSDRHPHGEVGIAVGTGGYRSIYGTTVMPLGKDGVLALSFANTQNDPYRYGYGFGYGPRYRR